MCLRFDDGLRSHSCRVLKRGEIKGLWYDIPLHFENSATASGNGPDTGATNLVAEGACAESKPKKCPGKRERKLTAAQIQSSDAWQDEQWQKWPSIDNWPWSLTVYEAAAILRVSPEKIRSSIKICRDGKAKLAHRRVGVTIRIQRSSLLDFGVVQSFR